MRIVTTDIGGTHARFALVEIEANRMAEIGEAVTLATVDHADFESAWTEFDRLAGPLPRAAAIAIAGPVMGDLVPMTNGPWTLQISKLRAVLGLEKMTVLNDFGAVAHAAAEVPAEQLIHITGPDQPLPRHGTITVIGPGTGLGIAHLHRFPGGYVVQATEGGHIGFAPQDEIDDRILARLRASKGRVVTEHVHAGPGIRDIYMTLGGKDVADERTLWELGIARRDELAGRAVERFCASLGTVAGDYALAHGASAVVLAGGVGLRLRDILPSSQFGERFRAKPKYEPMMAAIPVKLMTHPQPGLFGAAVAFAREHL